MVEGPGEQRPAAGTGKGALPQKISIEKTNEMDREEFVSTFGPVYERSPWVAGTALGSRPFYGLDDLHGAMVRAVDAASEDLKMGLIRAHPDLAGKAAVSGDLTSESAGEQSSVGLDRLTPREYEDFTRMNLAYRERFGMPMIVCVRDHPGKESILRQAEDRLRNSPESETLAALGEVHKIARRRLEDLVEEREDRP